MRTELPVCKRCCFCLPLRYGLITWGYLKLMAATILSIMLLVTLVHLIEMLSRNQSSLEIHYTVVISLVLVMLLTDVALNTVFIVGGHTKNVNLLQIYYIYSIVMWGLTIALVVLMAFVMMPVPERVVSFHSWLLILDLSSSFVNIILQTYFLLLLRSEIIKLRNNCDFRFVNNAAEAVCIMNYKEGLDDEEKGTEDISETGRNETEETCGKTCHTNGTCHKNEDQN